MAEDILKKYKEEQTNSLKEYLKSQINLIKGLGKTELADKNIPKEDKAIFKDVISQITSTMNVGSKPKREAYITAGKELTEIQQSLTSLAEDPDLKFNKGFMAALNAPTKNSATGIALNFIKEKQPSLPGAAASGAVNKMKEVSGGFLKTMAMDIVGGLPFGGAIVDWASTKVEGAVEGIGKGKKLTETELGVGRAFSPGGVGEDDEEENGEPGADGADGAGAEANGGTSEVIKDVKEEIMGGESTGSGGGGLEFTNELLINIDDNLQWIRDNSDSAETKREMRRKKGKELGGELVSKEGMEGMDDDGGPGFWSNFLGSMIGTGGLGGILGIKKMIGTGIFGGKGGLFRNLKAALLRTARTAFGKGGGQMLSKIFTGLGIVAKLGAIAGVLIAPIIDGITGYFNAEKWDVSKLSGIIGGILGGGEGGGINAIFNSMKWAAAGAAAGTLIMPGVGTLIGGIGGAILGAILGFFGGDKIAKLMDSIGEWIGEKWAKLKVFLGFEKETEGAATKRIAEERKTLETQLETAKKKKINAKTGFASQDIKDENIARMEAELGQLDEQSANLSAGLGGITEEEKASKIKRTQSKLDMMKSHLPNATAHQKEMWVTGVGGGLGEIEKLENELKLLQETEIPHSQTGMGIAETTDEKGGLLVAHRGEEVIEKEEISALKKMTDVAKKTIDGKGASLLEGTDFDSMEELLYNAKESAGYKTLMDNFLTSEMLESKHGGMLKNVAMLFGLAGHGQLGKTKKHGTMVDKFSMGPETIMNLFEKLNYFKERGDYVRGEVKEGRGGKGRARNISELNAVRAIQEISKSMALLGDSPEEKEALDRYEKMSMEERILSEMSREEAEERGQALKIDLKQRWDNVVKSETNRTKRIDESFVNFGKAKYDTFAKSMTPPRPQVGSQLNAAAMDRVGFGREKSSIAPTIIDASTVQNVSNNTLIRPPSPSGQFLPGERRDFG